MRLGLGLIASLWFVLAGSAGMAQDMKPPRLSFAKIDWPAALSSLANVDLLGPVEMPVRARRSGGYPGVSPALARLNGVMAQRFIGIAESRVPVLLPFDVEALLRDQAAGTVPETDETYLPRFHAPKFFYPGPSGYDAAFAVHAGDFTELSDNKFAEPIEVLISGSALLYELDAPIATSELPTTNLQADFPGIRRFILEHSMRYAFERFGVPYVVSIACFDTSAPREKLPTCRMADVIAQHFLHALHVVGGTPRNQRATKPLPIERPARVSQSFGYYGPGQILSGTGFHGLAGRVDYTIYSQIRFPLADAPAYANSELFQSRTRTRVSDLDDSPNISYAWRDNFCERRAFPVGACPAGMGHQGQDIRPAQCQPMPGSDRCERYGEIVAARGGMILRSQKREAAFLFVNTATEHIRFRYLHMSPRKMDADNLLSGRRVDEGELIGEVSNFSMKEAGTSYHLHFDVQVLTRDGWVFVNPYMTLVAAYERLLDARGTELADPHEIATTDPAVTGSVPEAAHAEQPAHEARPTRASRKSKPHRHKHYARD